MIFIFILYITYLLQCLVDNIITIALYMLHGFDCRGLRIDMETSNT